MLKKMTIVLVRKKSGNSNSIHALKSVFGRVIFGIVLILLCSFEARAQFIVQPMQINVQGPAGSLVRRSFKLENRDKFESQFVEISVVDLIQGRDGSWTIFDSEMLTESNSGFNFEVHSSCKDWISIRRTEVVVQAFDIATESMEIRIPSKAKGFSCAGLRVALEPRPGLGGVAIRFEFIVPICLTIEGRALRSSVQLQSSGLKFLEAKDDQQESTNLVITVKNDGGTYSKLTPVASIWQVLPSRTQLVARDLALPEIFIIPGAEVDIAADLKTSLPTGTYKIVTSVSVDGRRGKGLTEEIDYKSPVSSGVAHENAAMRLLPGQVDLEVSPGRSGNQKIVIRNYSDEDIVVKAIPVVPEVMAGKFLEVRGEDLSCVDWLEIRPNELPIRAGGERQVTVVARMPKEDELPALDAVPTNYYGTIKFYGFYRDRSSAGMTSAMVNVIKKGAEPMPVIQARSIAINSLGESRFQVVGAFSNLGMTHVVPTCAGVIESQEVGVLGSRIQYGTLKMVNDDADRNLMPFETRQFSAEMDFSDVPVGKYVVTATLSFGLGDSMFRQTTRLFEVTDNNGEKMIYSAGENTRPVASSGG